MRTDGGMRMQDTMYHSRSRLSPISHIARTPRRALLFSAPARKMRFPSLNFCLLVLTKSVRMCTVGS